MPNQEKTSENKVVRNDKGQVISGTPNPNGRPKGAGISITTAIKRELEKIPEGQKATYLDLLVKKILKKGIVEGDNVTIKSIWNYVDGMPPQEIKQTNMNVEVDEDITKEKADEIRKALFNSTPQLSEKE